VGRYQKGKTNLDLTETRDSEWQWHQLGNMQVSTLLQTDNHTSTPPLSFYTPVPLLPPNQQRHCVKELKAPLYHIHLLHIQHLLTTNTGGKLK